LSILGDQADFVTTVRKKLQQLLRLYTHTSCLPFESGRSETSVLACESEEMDRCDKEDPKGLSDVNEHGYDGDAMGIRERTKKNEQG